MIGVFLNKNIHSSKDTIRKKTMSKMTLLFYFVVLFFVVIPASAQIPLITIGRTASRVGPSSTFTASIDHGWAMFFDFANKTGGVTINGTKYQFVQTTYNDGSDPEIAGK
jgi:ABC-type branched-subunit amino acid transport system substrate-binding protein